jgi:hypothetical protein
VVVCGDLRQLDVPILHAEHVAASIEDALEYILSREQADC